jgi:hypothetical protein
MLNALIAWSARNKFLVVIMTVFITLAGIHAVWKTPLDALPDLSDVQVIIYTEVPGQAPQVVEDQVTYPLTTAMLSVPKSKVVRGFSFFGASFVYVIFEDGTDIYWARSRVLEYLNFAAGRLPRGITPQLGPDATGVGWVYQYVLQAKDKSLAELRTLQDWFVRYQLTKAPGVAEVASIGGFVQQYQVIVDPVKLRRLRRAADESGAGDPRFQPRRRRPRGRDGRDRIHGARPRLPARQGRHRGPGGEGRARHAGAGARHRPRRTGPGRAARHCRTRWRRRGGIGHRHRTLRPERAGSDPQRQGQARRDRARAAGRRQHRHGL